MMMMITMMIIHYCHKILSHEICRATAAPALVLEPPLEKHGFFCVFDQNRRTAYRHKPQVPVNPTPCRKNYTPMVIDH